MKKDMQIFDERYPSLVIDLQRTTFSTSYKITGKQKEALEWLESLKQSYHPSGYGTYGKIINESLDGNVMMNASRSNSCDQQQCLDGGIGIHSRLKICRP